MSQQPEAIRLVRFQHYDDTVRGEVPPPYEAADGEWVRFSDVESTLADLRAQVERLQAAGQPATEDDLWRLLEVVTEHMNRSAWPGLYLTQVYGIGSKFITDRRTALIAKLGSLAATPQPEPAPVATCQIEVMVPDDGRSPSLVSLTVSRQFGLQTAGNKPPKLDWSDAAPVADEPLWRVALVYSSPNPDKQIPWLADSEADMRKVEAHSSFIRWLSPHSDDRAGQVAAPAMVELSECEIASLIPGYFAEDWAIEQAKNLLDHYTKRIAGINGLTVGGSKAGGDK